MRVRSGQMPANDGVQSLQALRTSLNGSGSDELLADLLYQLWKLDAEVSNAQQAQQEARDLYQSLYAALPTAHSRERYLELGGSEAADLPTLPPLTMTENTVSWRDLIETRLREYINMDE